MNKDADIKRLPHKPPILMLDQVLESNEEYALTENTIKETNPFIQQNLYLSELVYVELMAQTSAIFIANRLPDDERPDAIGFVIGVDSYKPLALLKIHDTVRVKSFLKTSFEYFYIFECIVYRNNEEVCQGMIKIYFNPEEKQS